MSTLPYTATVPLGFPGSHTFGSVFGLQVDPTALMATPARCLELQQAPALLQVAELPMEVVERMLPLLPACTLLRSRAVCR